MSTNSAVAVNFAFLDSTARSYSMGSFAVNSAAVQNFKMRLQKFNSVDATSQKKFTDLADSLSCID